MSSKHRVIKGAELSNISRHHRQCRSNGGKTIASNISYVDPKQHKAFHTLFANKTPPEIAKILNEVWLDPAYRFVCVRVDDEEE